MASSGESQAAHSTFVAAINSLKLCSSCRWPSTATPENMIRLNPELLVCVVVVEVVEVSSATVVPAVDVAVELEAPQSSVVVSSGVLVSV